MDKSCRAVLTFIRNQIPGNAGYCLFADLYPACSAFTGLTDHQVMACIRQLQTLGFIRYTPDQTGRNIGIELEHKAYHLHYFRWASVRNFLVKSFFVPILVSILTTLVTATVIGWLQGP